ncbi:MAG: hypothetical protein DRO01_03180 [Thermoproteota archaeon]|nr:MAG: hypothetical protein DRO01_03180 [Candidatus Korarchaeota archaeon]
MDVAKLLGQSVVEGVVDSGTTSTLTDSARREKDGSFNGGTLWVLSGANAGAVLVVEGFGKNKITVATQAAAFAAGDQYALTDAVFPYWKIRQSINSVVGDVLEVDESLTFEADTYEYTLPALNGAYKGVEFVDSDERTYPSFHDKVRNGVLIFDYGFGGGDGDTIRILTKSPHDLLFDATDTLDAAIPIKKVLWDAVVDVLQWGVRQYRNDASKMTEEFLQLAMGKQEKFGKLQNDELPMVRYKAAGWGR